MNYHIRFKNYPTNIDIPMKLGFKKENFKQTEHYCMIFNNWYQKEQIFIKKVDNPISYPDFIISLNDKSKALLHSKHKSKMIMFFSREVLSGNRIMVELC